MKRYISSEYVGCGHPDKIADQISDSILDLYLQKDKNARVAAETLVSGNKVILAGEITSTATFGVKDIENEIIKTVEDIGYGPNIPCEFRSNNLDIHIHLKPQSPNIHNGVDKEDGNIGAGDQGIMFGYATTETQSYLPVPYVIAAELLTYLNSLILSKKLEGIYTDNKSQVCCSYDGTNTYIEKIILSSFHHKDLSVEDVRMILDKEVIDVILDKYSRFVRKGKDIELLINSAGPFYYGGPEADAGLTGRKIIVDTYGGFAPHGGGAFSGKDPSKVDRSAAYMARHIAKNLVASRYAHEALIQLSYAIGSIQPFSIHVKSNSYLEQETLIKMIQNRFDLSPKGIIEYLKLNDSNVIQYKKVAAKGHFLDDTYTWEHTREDYQWEEKLIRSSSIKIKI